MKHLRLYESDSDLKHKVYRRNDRTIEGETWRDSNDYLHREDGPADISYYPDGTKSQEHWWRHGDRHRDDGPAVREYWENGEVRYEVWYQNNTRHRTDGPAYTLYFEIDGLGSRQQWFQHGELHREDGPAMITYSPDGTIEDQAWYLDGHKLTGSAWIERAISNLTDEQLVDMALLPGQVGEFVRNSGKLPAWANDWLQIFYDK